MAAAARAAGNKTKVFDWDKAATLIRERKPKVASAGLASDWEWTGGTIFSEGKPDTESYTYLASIWATPELSLDGEVIACWKLAEHTPGWDSGTKWPESALAILNAYDPMLDEPANGFNGGPG